MLAQEVGKDQPNQASKTEVENVPAGSNDIWFISYPDGLRAHALGMG